MIQVTLLTELVNVNSYNLKHRKLLVFDKHAAMAGFLYRYEY